MAHYAVETTTELRIIVTLEKADRYLTVEEAKEAARPFAERAGIWSFYDATREAANEITVIYEGGGYYESGEVNAPGRTE